MRLLLIPVCLASTLALTGCAFDQLTGGPDTGVAEVASSVDGYPVPQAPSRIHFTRFDGPPGLARSFLPRLATVDILDNAGIPADVSEFAATRVQLTISNPCPPPGLPR